MHYRIWPIIMKKNDYENMMKYYLMAIEKGKMMQCINLAKYY